MERSEPQFLRSVWTAAPVWAVQLPGFTGNDRRADRRLVTRLGTTMTDDEVNATFDELMAEADLDLSDLPSATRLNDMSSVELMKEMHATKKLLLDRGMLLDPTTEEDKDLQGHYFGLVNEMRKRGML